MHRKINFESLFLKHNERGIKNTSENAQMIVYNFQSFIKVPYVICNIIFFFLKCTEKSTFMYYFIKIFFAALELTRMLLNIILPAFVSI